MPRVQIVKREPGKAKWEFVAHGAAWDRDDVPQITANMVARGCEFRLLPVRKGT